MRSAEEALPPSAIKSELKSEQSSINWLLPLGFLAVLGLGIGLSFIF